VLNCWYSWNSTRSGDCSPISKALCCLPRLST
jgi:hypothetical protein